MPDKTYRMKRGGMSKQEYNDMVDKKIKSREESKERLKKAREDFDLRRKAKEKSTSESLEKQREEFFKKLEKPKAVQPKAQPNQKREGEKPIAKPGKKPIAKRLMDYIKQDTPLTDKLPFRGLSPLTRARDIIKRDKPSKKSKGGLIKGFPRLAKKGF